MTVLTRADRGEQWVGSERHRPRCGHSPMPKGAPDNFLDEVLVYQRAYQRSECSSEKRGTAGPCREASMGGISAVASCIVLCLVHKSCMFCGTPQPYSYCWTSPRSSRQVFASHCHRGIRSMGVGGAGRDVTRPRLEVRGELALDHRLPLPPSCRRVPKRRSTPRSPRRRPRR